MQDTDLTKDEIVAIRRIQEAVDTCMSTLLSLPSAEESQIAVRTVVNAFITVAAIATNRPLNNVMTELFDAVIACNERVSIAWVKKQGEAQPQ